MKARIRPSQSLAATIALPAWCAPRNESIAIEKPRSGAPFAPALRHALQVLDRAIVEAIGVDQVGSVPGRLRPRHRLPYVPDRTALERERTGIDDRLVPEVERPEAGLPIERHQVRARAERRCTQPAGRRERARLSHETRELGAGTDRVARHQHDAVRDPVSEERAVVPVEVIVGVLAQLEERERVVTMATDEVDGRPASARSGQVPRSAQRPEEEVGEQEYPGDSGGADGQRQPLELAVDIQRGGVPGQHAARRAARPPRRPRGRAGRRAGRGDVTGSRCRVWARACGAPRPRVPHTEDFSPQQGAPPDCGRRTPGGRIGGGRRMSRREGEANPTGPQARPHEQCSQSSLRLLPDPAERAGGAGSPPDASLPPASNG